MGQAQQEAEYREPIGEIHTGRPLEPEQGGKTWQRSWRAKWMGGSKVVGTLLSRNLARAAGKHPPLEDPYGLSKDDLGSRVGRSLGSFRPGGE